MKSYEVVGTRNTVDYQREKLADDYKKFDSN
jgi:hypothetical protein